MVARDYIQSAEHTAEKLPSKQEREGHSNTVSGNKNVKGRESLSAEAKTVRARKPGSEQER
jgi:hypothetical protein